jgi:peroxiredoxin
MRRYLMVPLFALALLAWSCEEDPYSVGYGAPPAVGAKAPNFSQADTAGKTVTLGQFSGSVVLVDFWATWCSPCVSDIPNMRALWGRYRDQGLVIVSVSLDADLNAWRTFIRQSRLDWVQVSDGRYVNNTAARQYGVDAIPQKYLIGKDGKVIAGGTWIDEDAIVKALK